MTTEPEKDFQQWLEKQNAEDHYLKMLNFAEKVKSNADYQSLWRDMLEGLHDAIPDGDAAISLCCHSFLHALCRIVQLEKEAKRLKAHIARLEKRQIPGTLKLLESSK